MRYIEDKVIELPVQLKKHLTEEKLEELGPEPDPPDATLPEVLNIIMRAYAPNDKNVLDTSGLRSYNKVRDILDGDPENGYYAFEDTEYATIKKVVEWIGPHLVNRPGKGGQQDQPSRNNPVIMDAIEASLKAKPKGSTEEGTNSPPADDPPPTETKAQRTAREKEEAAALPQDQKAQEAQEASI